jgi:hypothetical protein
LAGEHSKSQSASVLRAVISARHLNSGQGTAMPRIGSMITTLFKELTDARLGLLRTMIPAVTVILVGLSGHGAWSQAARTIKIVVPLAPGGGADILARLLAEYVGRAQRGGIVVENRAGAGSVIGTEAVSRAAPDGNTLLINTPNLVIGAHLRKLNYDPLTSFEPICELVNSPTVIAVNIASPLPHTCRSVERSAHSTGQPDAGERRTRNHAAHRFREA